MHVFTRLAVLGLLVFGVMMTEIVQYLHWGCQFATQMHIDLGFGAGTPENLCRNLCRKLCRGFHLAATEDGRFNRKERKGRKELGCHCAGIFNRERREKRETGLLLG